MEQIGFGQWLKDSARQPDFFFILIEIEKPIVPEIRRPRLSCDLDTRGFGCRKVSVPRFESRLQIAPKDTIEPNINR